MNSPRALRRLRACDTMRLISSGPSPEKSCTRWLLRGPGNVAIGDAATDIIFQLLREGVSEFWATPRVRCLHRGNGSGVYRLGRLKHFDKTRVVPTKLLARGHVTETQ